MTISILLQNLVLPIVSTPQPYLLLINRACHEPAASNSIHYTSPFVYTSKPYTTTIEYTEKSVTRDALATNEVPEVIKLKKGDEKM